MSSQTRPIPPSTFSALTPPKDGYVYFEHAGEHPFQPLAVGYSPVNAWWLAEASFLAYEKGSNPLKEDRSDRAAQTRPPRLRGGDPRQSVRRRRR